MGWVSKVARRDSTADASEDIIAALGGERTFAGKHVTPNNARTLIPVQRAISLRAGAIGSMPMEVFRGVKNEDGSMGRTLMQGSRPWSLLHDKANEWMTAAELMKLTESHLASWGNAFWWKERGADSRLANLWPLHPRRVQVGLDENGKKIYLVQTYAPTPVGSESIVWGEQILCTDVDILHIRGLSDDGLVGLSPIQMARQSIGSMMAQQEYEGRFWANDATPGVALVHPNKMSPEALARVRAIWDRSQRGPANARKTAILGEKIDIKQMSVPMADAQFVEIAQLRRTDIALLFGLPPYMLAGETGGGMTYSNTETQATDFVKWALRDSMTTIEEAITWDPDLMPSNWFGKFQARTLLRGSQTERFAAYGNAPHLIVNDIREWEEMPLLEGERGQMFAKEVGPKMAFALPDYPGTKIPEGTVGDAVADISDEPVPQLDGDAAAAPTQDEGDNK